LRADDRIDARTWTIAGVVTLGGVMSSVDTTVVNVALEPLARLRRLDHRRPVGGDRLPARARRDDPARRVGLGPVRRLAGLDRVRRPVVAFVLRARRCTTLIDLSLFRKHSLTAGVATTLLLGVGLFGALFLLALYYRARAARRRSRRGC
jgi:hypothetical protein